MTRALTDAERRDRIHDLTDAERRGMLMYLDGYAPQAVDAAFRHLDPATRATS